MSVFVKICGVTSESDALMATAMGADAVGFIFAPSKRQMAPSKVRNVVRELPPEMLTVGVFRDETPQRVVEVINAAGLRAAQLHGHESPAEAAWVRKRVPFVIKAFAAGDRFLERVADYEVDAILIDSPEPGSGRVFDWQIAESLPVGTRVILAGGLSPENLALAIERVRPWGVDVASGVESSPGKKDVRLTRAFINIAKYYDDGGGVPLEGLPHADVMATDPSDLPEEPPFYDWEEDPAAG